jgi:phosphate transport system substrate-binding protein
MKSWKKLATAAGLLSVCALIGSTTMAKQMDPNKIVIDGSTTVGPIAKAFAEYYGKKNPGIDISVSESGSGNGAKSLISGTCDIADMSRFMKEKEFQTAVSKGIFPVAHVVALDGIAVVVHRSNPLKGLTMDQVRKIYNGSVRNWKEVGGPDKEIVVIGRDTNSGTYETFEKLVLKGDDVAGHVETSNSNGHTRQRVTSTPAAIGYVGLGYIEGVKPLEMNGIMPNKASIVSGKYPIARPLYMFTNGYPEMGSHLYSFITLHLSKDGQRIIEAIGFIPLTSYDSGR